MTDALIDKARELTGEWDYGPTAVMLRALIARLEAAEKVCEAAARWYEDGDNAALGVVIKAWTCCPDCGAHNGTPQNHLCPASAIRDAKEGTT